MSLIFDIKRFAINDGPGIRTTIFLKGCPLNCVWCHNPEGISPQPQRLFTQKKCIGCQSCVEACPHSILPNMSDKRCLSCGKCTDACPTLALEMAGRHWQMDELMTVIEKEREVMETSGGGVTLCGGEPLMDVPYALEILDELGRNRLHRTVDTTLFVSAANILRVMDHAELFMVDLKHMDSSKHLLYTGVPNEQILANIRTLSEHGKTFWIRIPLIKGVNADSDNITAVIRFLQSLPTPPQQVNLLPYHNIGIGKHTRLGTSYNPTSVEMSTPSDEEQTVILQMFLDAGFDTKIGG